MWLICGFQSVVLIYKTGTLQYSLAPSLLDHQRLLKKREAQKVSKYRALVQQKGGEFETLVIGTSGSITTTAKKITSSHMLWPR